MEDESKMYWWHKKDVVVCLYALGIRLSQLKLCKHAEDSLLPGSKEASEILMEPMDAIDFHHAPVIPKSSSTPQSLKECLNELDVYALK